MQHKLDGLTIVCHFEDGILKQAVTRGDGEYGEDVTQSARAIMNLPLHVNSKVSFWVRGEVVMPKAAFNKLNKELIDKGEKPFANSRNAAAGSLRQKDARKTAERNLCVYFYDIGGCTIQCISEESKLGMIAGEGLPVVECSKEYQDIVEVYDLCDKILYESRENLPYDIDGAVIKHNIIAVQKELGEGTKYPNWAIAYKFKAAYVCSQLRRVEWQVGRTGQVTPVAVLDTVNLGGSLVDHASLHNVDYIKNMGLKLNDEVSIYKAAEIIPQVEKVIFHRAESVAIQIPTECPVCKTKLVQSGAALMCPNKACKQKIKAYIEFFGARDHMDIQGMGPVVVSTLVESGLVRTPADLYTLTQGQLSLLPGFGKRKVELLLAAIEESKKKPFEKVLAALGIEMLGDTTSKLLAKMYTSIDALRAEDPEVLQNIEGFGQLTADSIHKGLNDPDMVQLVARLTEAGLCTKHDIQENTADQTLAGISICITGSLSKDRGYFQELIETHGGKFASGVTSKTTYLLAGAGGGSKRKKAESLGIQVITEEDFERMIKNE